MTFVVRGESVCHETVDEVQARGKWFVPYSQRVVLPTFQLVYLVIPTMIFARLCRVSEARHHQPMLQVLKYEVSVTMDINVF